MKIIKKNYKLFACFTAKELTELLLKKDMQDLMTIAFNNSLSDAQKIVNDLAQKQSKLTESSELWTAVFGLYNEFNKSCDICFMLKDSYNHNRDKIESIQDLISYKEDPPDISIVSDDKLYNFELKRYFGVLKIENLLDFVKSKILVYSEPYNFYITLHPESEKSIEVKTFEKLHEGLKKIDSKRKVNGMITLSFNTENKYIVNIQVFPDFKLNRYAFETGSEQVGNILNE